MLAKSPTPRALAKAATRQRLIEAARLTFTAKGYEHARIRDIAKLAGMSTGAFFANFEGKEAVYREVFGHGPISPEVGAKLLSVAKASRAKFEEYALLHYRKRTEEGDEKAATNQRMATLCDDAIALALAGGE